MSAVRTKTKVWARRVVALACVVATSVVATGVAQADAGHDHAGSAAKPASVTTTLGPVQRLGAGDWRALYGTAASTRKLAQASYRSRGCRIARTKADYTELRVRTFSLFFNSRFCWDKGKKKAVQRGLQDAHHDVSPFGSAGGRSISGDTPLKAFSQRWHGASKGMTHMNARYELKACASIPVCEDYTIYISQHGHYDGSAYDHQYTTKH